MEEGLSRPSSVRPSPPQPAPNIFTESHPELANLVPPFVLFPQRARARVAHACNLMRGRYLFSRGRAGGISAERGISMANLFPLLSYLDAQWAQQALSLPSAILPRLHRERKKSN